MQPKISIVLSEFNHTITQKLLDGTLTRLRELNISEQSITIIKVPGAIEIPLAALLIAQHSVVDAIIALGAVIRGETSHYDYVCQQASQGCQHVMLSYEIPVIFGILTTDNFEQARARVGGEHGHKGKDAADAALQMISVKHQIVENL